MHPLTEAVASYGLPGSMLELPAEPLGDADWHWLLADVAEQRLSGLLQSAMNEGTLAVTPVQRAATIDLHTEAMVHALLLERMLLGAVDVLALQDISVRVLKGTAVAHLDYSDASQRPFGDVDLLVESRRFDDAVSALVQAGFVPQFAEPRPGFTRRFGKGMTLNAPDGYELDLHRTFVTGPFGLTVDLDKLWLEHEVFGLGGRVLQALTPEARVLHGCYHAMLTNWPPRLQPLRDVAEMLLFGRYDDQRLRELARAWRCEAVLAAAVERAWQTFHIEDVTALSVWARRFTPDVEDARRLRMYQRPDASYAIQCLASVGALPRLREKAAFVRALALPSQEFLDDRRRHGYSGWLSRGLRRGLASLGSQDESRERT
jgi:hypothetical protein